MDGILPVIAFVFVWTACVLSGLAYERSKRRERIRQRLTVSWEIRKTGFKERFLNVLAGLGRYGVPKKEKESLRVRNDLLHGGFHGDKTLFHYYGARLLLGLVPVILFPMLLAAAGRLDQRHILYTPFLVALGYYLPRIFVQRAKTVQRRRIFRELPDTIDLLVIGLEAGLSLDAALLRVSREMRNMAPTVSREFDRYLLESQGGIPRNDALLNIKKRSPAEGLRAVVDVLLQSVKFGTDMGAALRAYAESMRHQRVILAQEKAAKVAPKLTIPMILFILPALIIVILGPGAIRLLERVSGGFF